MQKITEKYAHITTEKAECTVTLNREQQCAILYAYDRGISAMDAETIAVLDSLMNELKEVLHP
jgi:hypothetical protein